MESKDIILAKGINDFVETYRTISEEDVSNWGPYARSYLIDILNGEYSLDEAREDVLSFRKENK